MNKVFYIKMHFFISDEIFDNDNIHSYNGQLLNKMKLYNEIDCVIIFIQNDKNDIQTIYEYLENNNIYLFSIWKSMFKQLKSYKIFVCSKENVNEIIKVNNVSEVNYYCIKENILYNSTLSPKKILYLNEYDKIVDSDYDFFDKIYCFNSSQSNTKVEFIPMKIMNFINNNYIITDSKECLKNKITKKDENIVFVHIMDENLNMVDRVVFAIKKLQQYNIRVIVYMPVVQSINVPNYTIMENEIVDGIFNYNYHNEIITMPIVDETVTNRKINMNFKLLKNKGNTYYNEFKILLDDLQIEYDIINTVFQNENELYKYIYLSDVYIPVYNHFNDYCLLAQKYETYCLFLNDSYMSSEYCLYGVIPCLNTKDLFYNMQRKRIETVLRVDDVKKSMQTYFEQKNDPTFNYNKEITKMLFNVEPYVRELIDDNTETYSSRYGLVTLYKNEAFISIPFKKNEYWDEDTLLKLKKYINPNRNILEIGGHCGTSTLVYSSYLSKDKKCYVFEPQENMFKLLVKNIQQNNLEERIIPYNKGVFCYTGTGNMNDIDLDGGQGIVEKRYNEESDLNCNFGGISLGKEGEPIELIKVDDMTDIENIGYIHCDAQGSENFIFSGGVERLKKDRPVILYENNEKYAQYLYNAVCQSYPQYKTESKFDIKKYCMEELNYSEYIDRFNGSDDCLLIP